MTKKTKKYELPKRRVTCETCGHQEMVEYESSKWDLTSTCPKCAEIKAAFPALYEWIYAVVERNKMTKQDVLDLLSEKEQWNGYY